MSAVFLRATAHAFLVALVAASGLAFAQSPRVTPPQPPGSAATRPAPAPAPQSTTPRTSRSLDRIVAVVNDEVITANELRTRAAIADAQLRGVVDCGAGAGAGRRSSRRRAKSWSARCSNA
jgi:hypothetical protein